jgi:hypothetical protein
MRRAQLSRMSTPMSHPGAVQKQGGKRQREPRVPRNVLVRQCEQEERRGDEDEGAVCGAAEAVLGEPLAVATFEAFDDGAVCDTACDGSAD